MGVGGDLLGATLVASVVGVIAVVVAINDSSITVGSDSSLMVDNDVFTGVVAGVAVMMLPPLFLLC